MKTLIMVSSIYLGNTMKIAKAMAEEMDAVIKSPKDILQEDIDASDLIGIGSPIVFASLNKEIMNAMEKLSLKGKKVFIFSTRCNPMLGKYHARIKESLAKKEAVLLGEFSCKGFDRTGPWIIMDGYNKNHPNAKDLFKAKVFASKMRKMANPLSKYKKDHPVIDIYKGLEVRGNVFGHIVMLDTNACIKCEKCLKNCPLDVFSVDNEKVLPLNENDCTLCGKCAKNCPSDAIYITENAWNGINIMLRDRKLAEKYWRQYDETYTSDSPVYG